MYRISTKSREKIWLLKSMETESRRKSSRKRTFWRVFYSPLKRPFSVFKIGFCKWRENILHFARKATASKHASCQADFCLKVCCGAGADLKNKKPGLLRIQALCGRWDLNPHDVTTTRSLVLLVCQFRHFRVSFWAFVVQLSPTCYNIPQPEGFGKYFFEFF